MHSETVDREALSPVLDGTSDGRGATARPARNYAAAKTLGAVLILASLFMPWASCTSASGQTSDQSGVNGNFLFLFLWPIVAAAAQWFRRARLPFLILELVLCATAYLAIQLAMMVIMSSMVFAERSTIEPGSYVGELGLALYFLTTVVQMILEIANRRRKKARGGWSVGQPSNREGQ